MNAVVELSRTSFDAVVMNLDGFVTSRGMTLPSETVRELASQKDRDFQDVLALEGAQLIRRRQRSSNRGNTTEARHATKVWRRHPRTAIMGPVLRSDEHQ